MHFKKMVLFESYYMEVNNVIEIFVHHGGIHFVLRHR